MKNIQAAFLSLIIFVAGCGSGDPIPFTDIPPALSSEVQTLLKGRLRQLNDGSIVLADSEGTPAAGLEVRLLGLDGSSKANGVSDGQGNFHLIPTEVEGRLEVRRNNQVVLTRDFSFLPDQEVDANRKYSVSRAQAVQTVLANVPSSALVRATHNPIPAGRVVGEGVNQPGGPPFQLKVPDAGAYLFFVDNDPLAAWSHDAEMILVNAATGELTRHTSQWWPSIDHSPLLCPNDLAFTQKTADGFSGTPSRTIVQTPPNLVVADLSPNPPPLVKAPTLARQTNPDDCFAFLLPGTTEDWVTGDVEKVKAWCQRSGIPDGNIVEVTPSEDDDNAYLLQARHAYEDLQFRIERRNKAGGHTCLFVFVASHGSPKGELFVSTNRVRLALQKLTDDPPLQSCERVLPIDRTKACQLRLLVSCCRGANHLGIWRQELEKKNQVPTTTEYELYANSATGPTYISSPQLALAKLKLGQIFGVPGSHHVVEWVSSVVFRDCQILNFPPPRRTILVDLVGGGSNVVFDFDTTNPAFQGKAYTKTPFPSPFNPGDPNDPLNQRYANLFAYGQVSDWASTAGGVDGCGQQVSRVELIDSGGFAFSCVWDAVTGRIDAASKSNNQNLNSFGVGAAARQGQATLYTTSSGQVQGHAIDGQGSLSPVPGSPYSVAAGTIQLTLTPSERFLYAISGPRSQVTGFGRNSGTGGLTPLVGSPFTSQSGPVGLCSFAQGGQEWVCTTNGAQLETFRVAGDGALTSTDQDTAPVFNVVGSSQQPFVYADTVSNNLRGFRLDPTLGSLTPLAGSPFPRGGQGPLGKMLIHPSQPLLFCPNPNSGDISVQRIADDGKLSPVAGSPFLTVAKPDTVNLSPSGDLVYVSSSQGNGISIFRLDPASGALTSLGVPIDLNAVSGFFFP